MTPTHNVVIIGGGAAGLMCAISAAKLGKKVIVIEHAKQIGRKILMSGGGRCNFTNYQIDAENYLSNNQHFCKSALSRYTQWDFIELVEKHNIAYHEKTLGQLFCDDSSKDILAMLLAECEQLNVTINKLCSVNSITNKHDHYFINTNKGDFVSPALVIATGGLSIPTMGATGFGYQVAEQFGHTLLPRTPGLVAFTLNPNTLKEFEGLSGTSFLASVTCSNQTFKENILLTHRGISGPAILQISSYWQAGDAITINLLPDSNVFDWLKNKQRTSPASQLNSILSTVFSKKLANRLCTLWFNDIAQKQIVQVSDDDLQKVHTQLHSWTFKPSGTEGYRKAEVTLGGINTNDVSSKTFESKHSKGLYFIGEVLDVTGHLGGYNFQWAWASGFAAGQAV